MVEGKRCFSFSKEKYQYGVFGIYWDDGIGLCTKDFRIGLQWIRDHLEFHERLKPMSSHPPKILGNYFEIGKKFFKCRKTPLK